MKINYNSFGTIETGGYRHEKFFFQALVKYYSKSTEVQANEYRLKRYFTNPFQYLKLMIWGYRKCSADIQIVPTRLGLSALIRHYFSNKKVMIVMHNFDENDGKSNWLKVYYSIFFKLLKSADRKRFSIIVVSPYFQNYFKQMGFSNTYLFPNLFDVEYYKRFITTDKKNEINLGQYSSKNDEQLFELAEKLNNLGYKCYFFTLNKAEARTDINYEIVYLPTHEAFLQRMAQCLYTISLIKVNEGWSRVSHESILVGTQVIGCNKGGLGDLLRLSNSHIIEKTDEAIAIIDGRKNKEINTHFFADYDISQTEFYLSKICQNP